MDVLKIDAALDPKIDPVGHHRSSQVITSGGDRDTVQELTRFFDYDPKHSLDPASKLIPDLISDPISDL
jgi:hypothetical protein